MKEADSHNHQPISGVHHYCIEMRLLMVVHAQLGDASTEHSTWESSKHPMLGEFNPLPQSPIEKSIAYTFRLPKAVSIRFHPIG